MNGTASTRTSSPINGNKVGRVDEPDSGELPPSFTQPNTTRPRLFLLFYGMSIDVYAPPDCKSVAESLSTGRPALSTESLSLSRSSSINHAFLSSANQRGKYKSPAI